MYTMYPKDRLLLHLGQEQGIAKVIGFEHIFITLYWLYDLFQRNWTVILMIGFGYV